MGDLVETRSQPRQPYVAVRATMPMDRIGAAMGPLFGRLFGWLGSHATAPAGEPWTRYLSVGTEEVELELGAPVGREMAGDGDVVAGVLPAMEVATTLHVGPYDRLPEAYAAVDGWLREQGLQVSGAMWEQYLDGPDAPPERTRTRVCFPFSRE